MGLFYLDEDIDQENKILSEHNPYDWVEWLLNLLMLGKKVLL